MLLIDKVEVNLDDKFTKMLLDIYSEYTGLSIVFNPAINNKPIYSYAYWPSFCQKITTIIGSEACAIRNSTNSSNKGLYQCNAGLWCYSYPVESDGKLVGTFLVGHRRIKGKMEESKKVLKTFLYNKHINDKDSKTLMQLFEQLEDVDQKTFEGVNLKLLGRLSFIEQYVIREHQRAIEEHSRAIAFKNEAVSLAHEFILPIQSIIADAENLFNEANEMDKEIKSFSMDILQEITKLYYTAENIRGSFLESMDAKYEFHQNDIFKMILETTILFRKEANRKGVIIKDPILSKDVPITIIEMSEPHIKQVLFNLFHNAVKYSYSSTNKSRRYISILCYSYKNLFCLEVTNFGIGILPEEISKGLIFQQGYRGKLSRDLSRIGSGFGLGRVKEIVENHNGFIEIISENVGTGLKIDPYKTTVKICVPITQPRRH